ncbi:hypothetical protein WR25_17600 isoform E [Diploscapter pachys]|nr:hypothetical protein WR25_17600 isoform E [Diploscapter pachys]
MVASLRLLESVINSAENDEKLQPERDAKLFAKYDHIIQQMNLKVNLSEKRKSPVSKEKKPNLVENAEDRNKENDPNSVKEDAEQEQDASAKKYRYMCLVTACEFASLQSYLKRSMKLDELNEVAIRFNDVFMEKTALLKKPYRQLNQREKEKVDKWREQITDKTGSGPFCLAEDLRAGLSDKARTHLDKAAIPCLRHLKRIRENRIGPKMYYFPMVGI